MASKRRMRWKGCEKKVRHPTRGEALVAWRIAKSKWGGWLVVYRCDFCAGYHVGHPPRRVRQSIRARRDRKP